MDPTLGLVATFLMLAIYGAIRYAQQTFGDNPKQWDSTKFFILIGVGIVVVVGEWYLYGTQQIPGIETFNLVLPYLTTIFGTLGASLTVLLGGKYIKTIAVNKALVASVTSSAPTGPMIPIEVTEAIEHLGFTVTPAFLESKSPFLAVFQIKCSTICIGWRINWKDGANVQEGGFATEGGYNVANVYHMYNYSYDGKYTGHTFYPEISIISKDGVINTFNTEATGRCLSIGVNA